MILASDGAIIKNLNFTKHKNYFYFEPKKII